MKPKPKASIDLPLPAPSVPLPPAPPQRSAVGWAALFWRDAWMLFCGVFLCWWGAGSAAAGHWPAWRGPDGMGKSSETNLPVRWSPAEHVKWRVPLPEPGNSTPIVWGDRVFVTQAVKQERTLLCFARGDGRLLWRGGVTARFTNELTHATNPFCSSSPVTDGERVIAWFGSEGLHCYDFAGRELWARDLGMQRHIWGYGSSPVILGDLCFLNFGPGEHSFLFAVNKRTGETVWRHDEETGYGRAPAGETKQAIPGGPTYIGSWSTPVVMAAGGRTQLLMTWPGRLVAYHPLTGRELWSCPGLNPLVYTSPICSGGTVVAMGGFNGMSFALRTPAEGVPGESDRLWHHPRTQQRIGSGVIHEGHIYIHNDPGIAECFELQTGKLIWQERLRGSGKTAQNWSSVLLAAGNCYTITQGGDCFVFKANPKFELVAVNSLNEPGNSSIVPSDGELFIRTHAALWCIR